MSRIRRRELVAAGVVVSLLMWGLAGMVIDPQAGAADGPVVSMGDASGLERDTVTGSVFVPVFLSEPSAVPVTVSYFTVNATAVYIPPEDRLDPSVFGDYQRRGTPEVPRTITVPAGALQTTINVLVNLDDEVELDESFSVVISSVSGADATVGDDTGVATIIDADSVSMANPAITVSSGSVVEGDSGQRRAQFHVHLSSAPTSNVTITYATADGTAVAAGDYTAKLPGTVVFAPGQISKTIDVLIGSDATVEGDRSFGLEVAVIGGSPVEELTMTGTATIVDDDAPPPVVCAPGSYSATGNAPCTPAPAGSFVATTGATTATPCPTGTYQPNAGQTACLAAPLGFFVPGTGATAATAAPAGTFVDIQGAASATPCAAGSYQPSTASQSCLLAPIGSYVATTGSTTATACASGFTTLAVGSTSAAACVALPKAVAISAGEFQSCAVMEDGTVRCWSSATSGTPVTVSGITTAVAITSSKSDSLSSPYGHFCAALADGTVRCWGNNSFGQLGNGTTGGSSSTPVVVSGLTNAIAISAGRSHSCALLGDSTVRCWGNNSFGQLGNGTSGGSSNTPVVVTGLTNVSTATTSGPIATGDNHSCALRTDGAIYCWGANGVGQLGTGVNPFFDSNVPVLVGAGAAAPASALTAGGNNTCALFGSPVGAGYPFCWGRNDFGQLGIGDTGTPQNFPAPVFGLTSLSGPNVPPSSAIATGGGHTCASVSDGTTRCWGSNTNGQLGNGTTTTTSSVPVTVSGLLNPAALTAGWNRSCALVGGFAGTPYCWGAGSANVPVAVTGFP